MFSKIILSMAALRVISGTLEILAAIWILRLNQVDKALMVNTGLAVVGPLVLLTTTTIGLVGIADKISLGKFAWIIVGVSCIFIGILKK
ncbi:YqhV family protein [Paenibacillus senegalensis]|uniref:YqhV family protein n=1 Tax=Paenibacillus senegalensis TaxID=1465766 RepID=UPI000287D83C|nr:YqhV family protein [Paenibacillus senegalensis]